MDKKFDPIRLRELLAGSDPVVIARGLIGVEVRTRIDGVETSGIITETEAYWAPEDQASHARNDRRTKRTEIFYGPSGRAYVYLIYGIHELFNVITGPVGTPHAVLLRAIKPLNGVDTMLRRRGKESLNRQLTSGPGVLTKALGIDRSYNGVDLLDENSPVRLVFSGSEPGEIVAAPRVGINYAGSPWVEKPWRFYQASSVYVSKLKPKK